MSAEFEVYVTGWQVCTDVLLAMLPGLPAEDWQRPTDCPGWSVQDIAAHLAAIEHDLATGEVQSVTATNEAELSSAYTQAGVEARRDRTPAQLIEELRSAVTIRRRQLSQAPVDLDAMVEPPLGNVRWTWRTLLRNRVIDLWVHEQDIRRAIDRPGGFDSPAAALTIRTFLSALPFVFAKRAGAQPGQSLRLVLDGQEYGVVLGEDGRGHPAVIDDPTATIQLGTEAFTILAAGRRPPSAVEVGIDGDAALAMRFLAGMAVTP